MEKFIIFDMDEVMKTEFTYSVGNEINVNNNSKYKCMDIIEINNCIYYIFNIGKITYNYNNITEEDKDNLIDRLSK